MMAAARERRLQHAGNLAEEFRRAMGDAERRRTR